MRPRRLELHGFTAFRDPQQIDFTNLDLFVITGPTGAGKTSLLDAMALALYGQVPRMGKHGLGQLVSHGKAEARILLEFGVGGSSYRVSRRLPRAGSQQGRLEHWSGEEWVDAVERSGITPINNAIVDLVRLDFESFCKAIVLPQGEFARFLKGEPGERRKTLVALLGLGAYERMGGLARERSKELRIRGEQTRAILAEQFADATPDALADTEQAVGAAVSAAEQAAETLSTARDVEGRRSAAVTQSAAARGLAERFAELKRELRSEVEACRAAEVANRETSARRETARELLEAAQEDRASAIDQRAEVVSRTGSGEQLARVTQALARRVVLDQRVQEAERLLEAATQTLASRASEHKECVSVDDQAKAAAEEALTSEAKASAEAERCTEQREQLQRRLADAIAAADEHATETTAVTELEREAAAAAAHAAAARSAQAEAEAASNELRRDHLIAALVAGLDPGDPCPICDRPLAEHPVVDPDVERRLDAAQEAVVSATRAADAAQHTAADAAAKVTTAKTRVTDAANRLAAALGDLEGRSKLKTAAAQAGTAASASEAALTDATKRQVAADEHKQSAALALAKAAAELEAAARERQLREEGRDQALGDRESALEVSREYFGEVLPEDAADRVAVARAELGAADDRAEAALRAEAAAREAFREADGAQRNTLAALNAIDLRLGQLRTRTEGAVHDLAGISLASDLNNVPEPSEARDRSAEQLASWCATALEVLEATARAYEDSATVAARDLVQLAAVHDLPAEDAASALAAIEAAERDAIRARARAEERLRRLGERVEQRRQLEAGVAEDATRIAVLDVLTTELRADHFIDFVIQETLDVLAVHASKELLRISDDRYSLTSREGEFSVIDHVNADEQRSVKTLSGGETFMASLSLALALSKHVSDLAGEGLGARLEAVFIDEGFGSLDPETLEEVIDALERLREDELLIGVISHVPALAERIGVGLHVQKDGNRSVVMEAN